MRIFACIVLGMIYLLAMAASAQEPAEDAAVSEEIRRYKAELEKSEQALAVCEGVIRQYADSPELEAKLKEPLVALLKVPYAMTELCHLLMRYPDKTEAIFAVMKTCDKVVVLNVLERVGDWGRGYDADLSQEIFDQSQKLRKEILDSIPVDQQLVLAEKCVRPRVWATSIADRFYKAESKRVETLYCRWADTELGGRMSDADEMHESPGSNFEEPLITKLVEMDTPKTIHAVSVGVERWGNGSDWEYVVPHAMRELEKSKQPEAMEIFWRIARITEYDEPYKKFGAINYLSKHVDIDGMDKLIAILDVPMHQEDETDRILKRNELLALKAMMIRQASTRPAITQPASTNPSATQPVGNR